jgi:hypothetical protein
VFLRVFISSGLPATTAIGSIEIAKTPILFMKHYSLR